MFHNTKSNTELWSDGDSVTWTWGSRNELLSVTGFDNDKISFSYDEAGRKIQQSFPNETVQRWNYNKAGFIETDILFSQGSLKDTPIEGRAFSYDKAGRKKTEVNLLGESIVYNYDSHGRLKETLYPESDEIKETRFNEYRNAGKYPETGDWSSYKQSLDTNLPAYRSLSISDKTGISESWKNLPDRGKSSINTSQHYWYDRYSYSASGSREALTTPWGRLENEYSSNDPTQISKKGSIDYTYDKAGNLVTETSKAKGTLLYSYNTDNRLTGYEQIAENNVLISYSYDALGRRNSRSRIESGSGVQTGTKEVWSYEGKGFNLLKRETKKEEFEITKAQLSANGTRTRVLSPVNSSQNRSKEVTSLQKYITTGRSVSCVYSLTDTPESSSIKRAAYSGNISITYLQLDNKGSVISQMNPQGEQTNKITYDAFGRTIGGSIDEAIPFGYNNKVMDTETGQYNYGYRDYTPTAGRFSTVDPIKDGTSWYNYCGNDPVNFVDLWGLCAESDKYNNEIQYLNKNIAEIELENITLKSEKDALENELKEKNKNLAKEVTEAVTICSVNAFAAAAGLSMGDSQAFADALISAGQEGADIDEAIWERHIVKEEITEIEIKITMNNERIKFAKERLDELP